MCDCMNAWCSSCMGADKVSTPSKCDYFEGVETTLGHNLVAPLEIVAIETDDMEYELPSYYDVSQILVHVMAIKRPEDKWIYRYDLEVLDDGGGCVFWINEGVGFDFWFDEHVDFIAPGYYVVEGITGSYIRGDGWMTDDREYWEFTNIREATRDEIVSMTLNCPKQTADDILFEPI